MSQNVTQGLGLTSNLMRSSSIFFTFPPAGPQTKGLVKSLDFPTQLPPVSVNFSSAPHAKVYHAFPRSTCALSFRRRRRSAAAVADAVATDANVGSAALGAAAAMPLSPPLARLVFILTTAYVTIAFF